jgi:hypothetical protein
MNARLVVLVATLLTLAIVPAFSMQPPESAVQAYFGNTLVCHNPTSGVVCRLWLNEDGSYFVFYNRGALAGPATLRGPFQIEMREGRYTVRMEAAGPRLCLRPAPVTRLDVENDREMFSAAECYGLPQLALGRTSPGSDSAGRTIRFWLMSGR